MQSRMKQAVKRLLGRAGYRIEGTRYTPRQFLQPELVRRLEFDDAVCRLMFERGAGLSFLQVGAYDGVSTDPLRRYIERCGWTGVMVEPQPRPAAALRALYAAYPAVKVLEAAIDRQAGVRTMYTVDGAGAPTWAGGMSSFDRDHLLRHDYALPGVAGMIRESEVACITFAEALAHAPAPDLLQIDVEGADAYMLALFPFHRVRPALVHFETKNLSRADKEAAFDLLVRHGYRVAPSGDEDALATLF